jgi:hypothetical protein
MLVVICKQIVESEDLCNPDDREEFDLGLNGVKECEIPKSITNSEEALDYFHENNPIGCLEDYEIWVEEG